MNQITNSSPQFQQLKKKLQEAILKNDNSLPKNIEKESLDFIDQNSNMTEACEIAQVFNDNKLYSYALKAYQLLKQRGLYTKGVLNNIGILQKKLGNYQQSIDVLKQITVDNPDYTNSYINLANVYCLQNKYKEALFTLNQLQKNVQVDFRFYYCRATVYKNQGYFDKTIQDLESCIELNKKYYRAYELLYEVYKIQNKAQDFMTILDDCEDCNIQLLQVEYYYRSKNYQKSIDQFNTFTQNHQTKPYNWKIWYYKSLSESKLTNQEEALKSLDQGLQMDWKQVKLYRQKIKILDQEGKSSEIEKVFEKYKQVDKKNATYFIANYYQTKKDYNKALKVLEDLPFDESYMQQGNIYRKLKEYEKAILSYDMAMAKGKIIEAYASQIITYAEEGQLSVAKKMFDEGLKKYQKSKELYYAMGMAYLLHNDYSNAEKFLKMGQTLKEKGKRNNCAIHSQIQLALGVLAMKQKDFSKAQKELNNQNPLFYYYRGILCSNQQNYQEANALFNYCIKQNPKNADYYYQKGIAKAKLKDYSKAVVCFDKAISNNPQMIQAYIEKLRIVPLDLGLLSVEEAIDKNPDSIELQERKGILQRDLEQYDEAIQTFSQVLYFQGIDDETEFRISLQIANVYKLKKDYQGGFSFAQNVLLWKYEGIMKCCYYLGYFKEQLNHHEEALKYYRTGLNKNYYKSYKRFTEAYYDLSQYKNVFKNEGQYYNQKGIISEQNGTIHDAKDQFKQAHQNQNLDGSLNLCRILISEERYSEILEITKETKEIKLIYFRGYAELKLNRFALAQSYFQQVLKIEPQNIDALLRLIETYQKLNQINEAIETIFNALKSQPKNYQLYSILGELYYSNGQTEKAIDELNKAIENNYQEAYYKLADIYQKENNQEKVIQLYTVLIEKNNDDSTPLKHLATYYESIGDYQNAAVYQQKIVLMKTPEAIILKAKKLQNENKLDEALQLLIKQEPTKEISILIAISKIYEQQENYNMALAYYNKVYDLDKKNKEQIYGRIKMHKRLRNQNLIIQACDDLINLEPHNYQHFFEKGKVYYEFKDYQQANIWFLKTMEICEQNNNPQDEVLRYFIICQNKLGKNVDDNQLSELLDKFGEDLELMDVAIDTYYQNQVYDKTRELIEKRQGIEENKNLNRYLGMIYEQQQDYDLALEFYKKCPNDSENNIYSKIGQLLLQQKKYEEALEYLQMNIKENNNYDNYESRFYLGLAFKKSKRYQESLEQLEQCIHKCEKNNQYKVWNEMGEVYFRMRNVDQSLSLLSQCYQAKGDFYIGHFNQGLCFYYIQKYSYAKMIFFQGLQMLYNLKEHNSDYNHNFRIMITGCLINTGDYSESEKYIQDSMVYMENSVICQLFLGCIMKLRDNNFELANQYFEKSNSILLMNQKQEQLFDQQQMRENVQFIKDQINEIDKETLLSKMNEAILPK